MGHHGPLLPSYFAERESDWGIRLSYSYQSMSCSIIKIQDTKFWWYILKNLLINGIFKHFKNAFQTYSYRRSTEDLKCMDSRDFDVILSGFRSYVVKTN